MNEFECIITETFDESYRTAKGVGPEESSRPKIKAASFRLVTTGQFPYEQLYRMVGRKVHVTLLD
jgi:hypothetical protein